MNERIPGWDRGVEITAEPHNTNPSAGQPRGLNVLIGVIVAAAVIGAGVVAWKMGAPGRQAPPDLPPLYTDRQTIPAKLMQYAEPAAPLDTKLDAPYSLAVGHDGRLYVGDAKERIVRVFTPAGKAARDVPVGGVPYALGVARDHTLYVALPDHVAVFDAAGKPRATWAALEGQVRLTSIAVGENDVFVAVMRNRRGEVRRYRRSDGKLLKQFDGRGAGDEKRSGFEIPSPYFDVALGSHFLWVVNPGRLRVEAYEIGCGPAVDADQRPVRWGRSGQGIAEFCGCCNPSHLALRNGGGFVTAEKGYTRVKEYDRDGALVAVVAGPKQFAAHDQATLGKGADGGNIRPLEVAVDAQDAVYVLDSVTRQVRKFVKKK